MGDPGVPATHVLPFDPFVGRDSELSELRAATMDAVRRRGRVFLATGDPGIGKTRLADEVAEFASQQGAAVAWGRCWEGRGVPAFWPWIQIVRDRLREDGLERALSRMGSAAAHLAQIVPEIDDARRPTPAADAADVELGRFPLFDAVTSYLMATSHETPLVLVLDDLHAADVPSLLLLQFFVRHIRQMHVLVYGTYREPEVQARSDASELLTEIAREGVTLRLGGLGKSDVRRVLEATAGVAVTDALAETVHRLTEGNPLFVTETARLLGSRRTQLQEGLEPEAALTTPDSVRHTIRRRLDLLSEQTVDILSVAAVFGREFDPFVLGSVIGSTAEELDRRLDEAVAGGVLVLGVRSGDRHRFSHGLIRDVLYEGLPLHRRLELHLATARALEDRHGRDAAQHLPELAHHYLEAAQVGGAEKAVEFGVLAAEQAVAQFAWEGGAEWYRRALAAHDLVEDPVLSERCDLLLGLGGALGRTGRSDEAREVFLRARTLARSIGAADQLAHAALGYGWVATVTGVADPVLIRLLEEALAALGDTVSALRVDVMTRLVIELVYAEEPELTQRRDWLAHQAMDVARAVGDPMALIYAVEAAAWAGAGPDNVAERFAAGGEILHLIAQHDEVRPGTAVMGHLLRLPTALEMGDVEAAERELRAYERVAETVHEADLVHYATVARAALKLYAGQFEQAESLARHALEIGEPARAEEARQYFGVQLLSLLRERGSDAELEAHLPTFEDLATRFPTLPALRAAVGCVYADLRRDPAASAVLQRLRAADVERLARNTTWLATLAFMAELSAVAGDAELAAVMYRLMEPYATHHVVFDAAVACYGSAERYLGIAAATTGDLKAAAAHFERAVAENARTGGRPYLAHSQCDYAHLLIRRGAPGDRQRAQQLLGEAMHSARDLGMSRLVATAETLSTEAPAVSATPPRIQEAAVFRREGDYWNLIYGGERIHLRDSKGLQFVQMLLANPGIEVHVLDLVASGSAPVAGTATADDARSGLSLAGQDAGPILDAQAKAAYRRRIAELREEVDDAEAMNDPERRARARQELEFLTQELVSAVGLAGRDRKAASVAERARVNVTRTIKRAVDRIAEQSPALGEHLSVSIQTGTFCCYRPDPRAAMTWKL